MKVAIKYALIAGILIALAIALLAAVYLVRFMIRESYPIKEVASLVIQDTEQKVVKVFANVESDNCTVKYAEVYQNEGTSFQQMVPLQDYYQGECLEQQEYIQRTGVSTNGHDEFKVATNPKGVRHYDIYSYNATQLRYTYQKTE